MPLRNPFFKKNRGRREARCAYTHRDTLPYLSVRPSKKDWHDADTTEFTTANVFAQDQSLFCRVLPPEVRMLIFEYTIGNHLIHVDLDYQPRPPYPEALYHQDSRYVETPGDDCEWQWWHSVCMGPHSRKELRREAQLWYSDQCQKNMVFRTPWRRSTLRKPNPQLIDIRNRFRISTALLTLCKKLYHEAMFILYSKNTFDFQRPTLLSTHLSKLWTPAQLKLLRSVQIQWHMLPEALPHSGAWSGGLDSYALKEIDRAYLEYDKLWTSLAELSCLSVLRVALLTSWILNHGDILDNVNKNHYPVSDMRTAWLGPIDRLKDKQFSRFELVLGFTWIQVLWSAERAYNALGEGYFLPSAAGSPTTCNLTDESEPFTLVAHNDTLVEWSSLQFLLTWS